MEDIPEKDACHRAMSSLSLEDLADSALISSEPEQSCTMGGQNIHHSPQPHVLTEDMELGARDLLLLASALAYPEQNEGTYPQGAACNAGLDVGDGPSDLAERQEDDITLIHEAGSGSEGSSGKQDSSNDPASSPDSPFSIALSTTTTLVDGISPASTPNGRGRLRAWSLSGPATSPAKSSSPRGRRAPSNSFSAPYPPPGLALLLSAGAPLPPGDAAKSKGSHKCAECGKQYKSLLCLYKHRWEHSPWWTTGPRDMRKLTKHQRVQMLEGASILFALGAREDMAEHCTLPDDLMVAECAES
jgi:hypothetical protein